MEFSAISSNEIKMEVEIEDKVLTFSQNENPTTENARQLESANGEQQEAVTITEIANIEMATNNTVKVMQDEHVFYITEPVSLNNVNQKTKFPSIQLIAPKLKAPPEHALKPFAFLYKLFLVAKSQHVRFINWSEDGLRLELHYLELQSHLTSDENIFRCGTVLQFNKQLLDHGFKRLIKMENAMPECPLGIILIYEHAHFVKDKPEKLQWIAKQIYVEAENKKQNILDRPLGNPSDIHLRRMSKQGDLCSSLITSRTELQMVRSRLMAIVHFSIDAKWLNGCGNFSKVIAQMIPRRSRPSVATKPQKSNSGLPRGGMKYVKPRLSVTAMPASQITEYAGYFGNVEIGLLKEFFAEYLPRYGNSKSEIVMDATTKISNFHQNLPIGINYSEDEDDGETLQSKGNSKRNTQAQSGQDCKVDAIDGSIEEFMEEICGDPSTNNLSASPTKSTARTTANTTTTTTSKPKVRKKRKLKEESSTEEEDDDEEILMEANDCNSMDMEIDNEPIPDNNNQIEAMEEKKKKEEKDSPTDVALEGENQESNPDDKSLSETGNDDSEEDEDFDDDDDYVDKNVEFRTSTRQKQSGTPRRYDLRNTKRPNKRYL